MAVRNKYAIIVAGGKGTRMNNAVPKQYLPLANHPVLYYSIKAFLTAYDTIGIILVYAEGDDAYVREVVHYFPDKKIILVPGGGTRFHSVKNGLQAIKEPSVIFVHDGVRPLVSVDLIHCCYEQALIKGNAVPAVPVKDSIRRIIPGGNTAEDRSNFRIIQTPQTFLSEIILPAFDHPYEAGFTDEATVVERSGIAVNMIPGEEQNIKITQPGDLWLASQLLLRSL